ncbi:MAG TPA: AsmA family protein [Xanthobacteraceae bacterium]
MIAAVGVKRIGILLGVLAAVGIGALVILRLLMPPEAVREAVTAEIRAVTGLDPELRGRTTISLFPTGSVRFDDVTLDDKRPGGAALTAEQVIARLRVFPFLIGRIEIADISLVRPTISIVFNSDRSTNWSGQLQKLAQNLKPGPEHAALFSEIRIQDGTVLLRDEAARSAETLSNVEFALAWPSISKSFAATGRFAWKGKPIDASISFTDFMAALQGERSGLKVRLSGDPFKLAFDGHISNRPTLKMEGTVAADTASLRDAMSWAGHRPPPGGGFGRFGLKAQSRIVGTTIGLSDVHVELDGNSAEGVLTIDGRQTLQGTLAAEALELTPYLSTVRLLSSHGERGWDDDPIALDGLEGADVDLRLSAARVRLANVRLGRTAVAVNLRGGSLTVAVGESEAFGGVLKGTFGVAKSANGADLKAQLQFSNVDLEQSLSEMVGIRKLEGKGNLGFSIAGVGSSVHAITKALNGTAALVSHKGALVGFNVEQLLRRIERRPLSGGSELRTGRTPYESLVVDLKITDGIANIEEARVEGPAVALSVTGSASIPARELDLRGVASLLSSTAGAAPAPAFELPFMVQGPWDDPDTLLDPQSRIQRSGAAAPLLEAVRKYGGRDAVRSAIERLTGGAPAAPPAAPPQATPALAGSSTQIESAPTPAQGEPADPRPEPAAPPQPR